MSWGGQPDRITEIRAIHEAMETWVKETSPAALGLYRHQLEIHRQRGELLKQVDELIATGWRRLKNAPTDGSRLVVVCWDPDMLASNPLKTGRWVNARIIAWDEKRECFSSEDGQLRIRDEIYNNGWRSFDSWLFFPMPDKDAEARET